MKLAVQVQLVPDKAQDAELRRTVERFNEAANWVAGELFARRISNKRRAQKLVYRELRDRFQLTAQTAILVIHRVCEAYKPDKDKQPKFRKHVAITYDARVLRFIGIDRVNLWTLAGRLVIPILIGKYQAEQFTHAKGRSTWCFARTANGSCSSRSTFLMARRSTPLISSASTWA